MMSGMLLSKHVYSFTIGAPMEHKCLAMGGVSGMADPLSHTELHLGCL